MQKIALALATTLAVGCSTTVESKVDKLVPEPLKQAFLVAVGGDNASVGAYGVDIDETGRSVVAGTVTGDAPLGAMKLSATRPAAFASGFSAAGKATWVAQTTGTGTAGGDSVGIMSDGGAVLSGSYIGAIVFGDHTLTAQTGTEGYVARVDAAGKWLWAVPVVGATTGVGFTVSSHAVASSALTGQFEGALKVGETAAQSIGGSDAFVASLDGNGKTRWIVTIGGTGDDFGHDVDARSDGSHLVTGAFSSTAKAGDTFLKSRGETDAFVARISAAGKVTWAQRIGGMGADTGDLVAWGLDGTVTILGTVGSDLWVGGKEIVLAAGSNNATFVTKLAFNGDFIATAS